VANKAGLSVTLHQTPKSCRHGGSPVYFDEHPCFILHTKRQKEPGKTIDESLGRVRSERVNTWPRSMIATWWWWRRRRRWWCYRYL